MQKKISTLTGIIIIIITIIILFSGVFAYQYFTIQKDQGKINPKMQGGNFEISITPLENWPAKQSIEIKNMFLPIDSQAKACTLLIQTIKAVHQYGYQFDCNFTVNNAYAYQFCK